MTHKFKQGDAVQLKSGGAVMTVRCIIGDGTYPAIEEPFKLAGNKAGDVLCEWHEKKKPQARAYPPEMLTAAGAGFSSYPR